MLRMRHVFGSIATTEPLKRPSPAMAACRTTGSSKVAMSPSVESAKVGTPRTRGLRVTRVAAFATTAEIADGAKAKIEMSKAVRRGRLIRCIELGPVCRLDVLSLNNGQPRSDNRTPDACRILEN